MFFFNFYDLKIVCISRMVRCSFYDQFSLLFITCSDFLDISKDHGVCVATKYETNIQNLNKEYTMREEKID